MTWVLIYWHKMWNCWPERYVKFQSEIPSTSGAICEKPQGGGLSPPPSAGRGLIGLGSPNLMTMPKFSSHIRWCVFLSVAKAAPGRVLEDMFGRFWYLTFIKFRTASDSYCFIQNACKFKKVKKMHVKKVHGTSDGYLDFQFYFFEILKSREKILFFWQLHIFLKFSTQIKK